MTYPHLAAALTIGLACQGTLAQQAATVSHESRDAASAFVGSMQFTVGRIGRDCLPRLKRADTPQQFVGTWQQHNIRYVAAAMKYLQARSDEATAQGGDARKAFYEQMSSVRATVEGDLAAFYRKNGKDSVCKRMVPLIDSGGYDITARAPLFKELEALVAWSQP